MKNVGSCFIYILIISQLWLADVSAQQSHHDDFYQQSLSECLADDCFDSLIQEAQFLEQILVTEQCLPSWQEESDLEVFFQDHIFSDDCIDYMNQLEQNASARERLLNEIEDFQRAHAGQCHDDSIGPFTMMSGLLASFGEVEAELNCDPEYLASQREGCLQDFMCALANNFGANNRFTARVIDLDSLLGPDCDPVNDLCLTQLATAFSRSVLFFFEGMWDLLKMAGSGIRSMGQSAWGWMRGGEDHTSTAQLAMAQASEDEGVFRMLVDDFPAAMRNLWNAISTALETWIKENVFCQQWEGVAYYSECLEPARGFDCLSCKQMINGLCSAGGIFVAEVIPAFVTGGIVAGIKHGANAAATISRSVRISDNAREAIRSSSLARYAERSGRSINSTSQRIGQSALIRYSQRGLTSIAQSLRHSLDSASAIYHRYIHHNLTQSFTQSGAYRVITEAGARGVQMGQSGARYTFKAVLYPIDNPMTRRAYEMGGDAYRGLLGARVVGPVRQAAQSSRLSELQEIDAAYLEYLQLSQRGAPSEQIQRAQESYQQVLVRHRETVVQNALENNPQLNLNQIIEEFYPELTSLTFASTTFRPESYTQSLNQLRRLTSQLQSPELSLQFQQRFSTTRTARDISSAPTARQVQNIEQLHARYLHYSPTDLEQNRRWIRSARSERRGLYVDIENSAIKRLNDSLGDKNLVTSITNMHKEMLNRRLLELRSSYPEVTFEMYSDFKSFRIFIDQDQLSLGLRTDLESALRAANSDFEQALRGLEGLQLPARENPAAWFQMGFGESADQAGLATRYARDMTPGDGELPYLVDFHDIRSSLDARRVSIDQRLDELRSSLATHPEASQRIFDSSVPRLEVFELLRKNSSLAPAELRNLFSVRLGVSLDERSVRLLQEYARDVDRFSPGLWIEQRVVANLDQAQYGGLSADFKGMGARNMRQVALDLRSSTDLDQAILQIRRGEGEVTRSFAQARDDFSQMIDRELHQFNIQTTNRCSGDDCVSIPAQALSPEARDHILRVIAQGEDPNAYRLSFIPPDVAPASRSILAVHGELIEKTLRREVTGFGASRISPEVMDQLTIGIQMPSQLGQGPIEIIISPASRELISPEQLQLLNQRARRAVEAASREIAQESAAPIEYTFSHLQLLAP